MDLYKLDEADHLREIQNIDGVVAGGESWSAKEIEAARNLKIIARAGAGFDQVDLDAASKRGIWVTNTPDATTEAVADFTLGLILCLIRDIPTMINEMRSGVWRKICGTELGAQTVGVIGVGHIGKAVIRRLRGFGSEVLAVDVAQDESFAAEQGFQYVELDELLRLSDIVTLHCAMNEHTRGIIDETAIAKMKPGVLLVNTARPGVIDKVAVAAALNDRRIAKAAIDVHDPMPAGADDPLVCPENVIPTPWNASNTDLSTYSMTMGAAEEVIRVLNGEKPLNPLNQI
jgi:phosphoglycerate dehydrogenase-like enzyme